MGVVKTQEYKIGPLTPTDEGKHVVANVVCIRTVCPVVLRSGTVNPPISNLVGSADSD